jgi:hypothetical protein
MFFEKKVRGVIFCDKRDKIKKVNKINTSRAFLAVTQLLHAVTNYIKVNKINIFYCDKEKLRTGKLGITCILKKYTYPFF